MIWQMANQGPKLNECGHFRRLGDKQGDQSYATSTARMAARRRGVIQADLQGEGLRQCAKQSAPFGKDPEGEDADHAAGC
jgi:hypothetical protein